MLGAIKKRVKKWLKLQYDPFPEMMKNGLVVGANFHSMTDVIIDRFHCWHIEIGDDVTLAPRVHILSHDASTKSHMGYTRLGKVRIGNRVFVGASAIILPGVFIGDDSIVGAGSIVVSDVPAGCVVAGNPAKVICTTEEFLVRRRKEMNKSPVFDASYHLKNNVSKEKRKKMNKEMIDRIGYMV